MNQLSPEEWTDYWSHGDLTTFGSSFTSGYDGEFLDFWKQHITPQHDCLIDLCCGNGALTWLASDHYKSLAKQAEVIGIDIANIDPFKQLKRKPSQYPGVRFIGNTSIDDLPLDSNSVDIAISQYGLEYSNLDKTIPELSRVIKPTGTIALIMHYVESHVLIDMRLTSEKFAYLLNEAKIAETVIAMDELYNSKKSLQEVQSDPLHAMLTGRMTRATYYISKMHTGERHKVQMGMVNNYLQRMMEPFQKGGVKNRGRRKILDHWLLNMELAVSRLEDLESAALNDEQYQHLIDLLTKEGFSIKEQGHIYYKQGTRNYGWKLVAERS